MSTFFNVVYSVYYIFTTNKYTRYNSKHNNNNACSALTDILSRNRFLENLAKQVQRKGVVAPKSRNESSPTQFESR